VGHSGKFYQIQLDGGHALCAQVCRHHLTSGYSPRNLTFPRSTASNLACNYKHQTVEYRSRMEKGCLMRRFAFVTLLGSLLLFTTTSTKAQGKIELFGGYSFVHAPVRFTESAQTCPVSGCPAFFTSTHLNLNGWEFSGAYRVLGPVQLAADFDGTYGSFHGASTHLQTYLFGPQIRFPGPVSPFAHLLIGDAHEAIGSSVSNGLFVTGPTQNSFATALGFGIDLKVLPLISVRPVQFDYLMTRFNSGTQNQPRFSAGVVLHF
jgi:hypothetical protein